MGNQEWNKNMRKISFNKTVTSEKNLEGSDFFFKAEN